MAIEFDGDAIVAAVGDDPEFAVCARDWTCVLRFQIGACDWDAIVDHGELVAFGRAAARRPDTVYSAPEERWRDFFAAVQKPLHTGLPLLAEMKGLMSESGDRILHNHPYAPAIHRIFEALRNHVSGAEEVLPERSPAYENDEGIIGRYVYIDVDGIEYRIYVEEAGAGVPLMLHHTAGCHGSQWRHMLADPLFQQRYRMIAHDLPFHGNSLPPADAVWWQEPYSHSKEHRMKIILALSEAMSLDRPMFMGCSIGGQLALDLAAHHPSAFRAILSLNGTYGGNAPAGFNEDQVRRFAHHPRIGKGLDMVVNYLNTAPRASETFRREVWWTYGQGGPGVLAGDIIYNVLLHDLKQDGHLIDAARSPLYVLVGEYDLALDGPGGTREIADHIPDIRFHIFEGMGHFPMTDEPVRFRDVIAPLLHEAASARISSA